MFEGNSWLNWLDCHPTTEGLLLFTCIVLFAILLNYATRKYIVAAIRRTIKNSGAEWAMVMIEHHIFLRLSWLIPLIIIHQGLVFIHGVPLEIYDLLRRVVSSSMILVLMLAAGAAASAVSDMYHRRPDGVSRPIKSYMQILKIFLYLIGIVLIIANLINQSPWYFISGIGAMTAILLLIFRDTILSLVAGVQLTGNDLIRVGDWIEMPQFNADGDVIDMALNTVKVRNWDNTVTVIPTHKFIENSFKNWRSMQEIGGRRIKRALNLDVSSIKFLSDEDIDKFSHYVLLKDYMEKKKAELAEYNAKVAEPGMVPNSRRLTNIGTLRAYIFEYLKAHPKIHQNMTLMVRQLEPGPMGLPLEIYAFTSDTEWGKHEGIQSDIFDHILAIVPDFGLRIYQRPGSGDSRS